MSACQTCQQEWASWLFIVYLHPRMSKCPGIH